MRTNYMTSRGRHYANQFPSSQSYVTGKGTVFGGVTLLTGFPEELEYWQNRVQCSWWWQTRSLGGFPSSLLCRPHRAGAQRHQRPPGGPGENAALRALAAVHVCAHRLRFGQTLYPRMQLVGSHAMVLKCFNRSYLSSRIPFYILFYFLIFKLFN